MDDKVKLDQSQSVYSPSNAKEKLNPNLKLGSERQQNKNVLSKKSTGSAIFSTNRNLLSQSENELGAFLNYINNEKNKIPNLKISYKEYLYSTPKCDICDQTGITNDELKKMNNLQTMTDAAVLEYIIHQCSVCKVQVHKNCASEVQNFPAINFKDKSMMNITWVCDKCKSQSLAEKTSSEICQICWKKETQLKKPHLYRQMQKDMWVHNWCLLWFTINKVTDEEGLTREESVIKKIKEFYLTDNCYTLCYRCQDSNYK
jgi:hypothetical protein